MRDRGAIHFEVMFTLLRILVILLLSDVSYRVESARSIIEANLLTLNLDDFTRFHLLMSKSVTPLDLEDSRHSGSFLVPA